MAQAVSWADVLACFADRAHPEAVIGRLVSEWARRYRLATPNVGPQTPVRREVWDRRQVGEHLDRLAKVQPLLITDDRPRRIGGAIVLVDFGKGRIGQIDGRRRANVWRHVPGEYEVLILCAS